MTAAPTASSVAAKASGLVLLTLAAGQFVMALDTTVMNTAIATVAKDVGTDVTGIQTAITLYTLVMASLMITGGRVGEIIGRKRAFTIGCVIYACGSLTTALSQSLTVLIIGWSFLEGFGAVLIIPAIVALVASNFAKPDRPRAYGLVAAAGAMAAALGPVIGGFFTTYASWRWVFVSEVLIVIVILVLARKVNDTPPEKGVKLDLVGTALSAAGLGLIVFGILRSGAWGFVRPKPGAPEWLGLSPVIWLVLAGGVVLGLFVHVGEPAHRARRGCADRPEDAAEHPAARRRHLVLLPVPRPGRDLLRRAAVPVGRARHVGGRDGRAAAAALADAAALRSRSPQGVPEREPAAGHPPRLHGDVRAGSCSSSPCWTTAPERRSSRGRCCSRVPGSARSPRSSGA